VGLYTGGVEARLERMKSEPAGEHPQVVPARRDKRSSLGAAPARRSSGRRNDRPHYGDGQGYELTEKMESEFERLDNHLIAHMRRGRGGIQERARQIVCIVQKGPSLPDDDFPAVRTPYSSSPREAREVKALLSREQTNMSKRYPEGPGCQARMTHHDLLPRPPLIVLIGARLWGGAVGVSYGVVLIAGALLFDQYIFSGQDRHVFDARPGRLRAGGDRAHRDGGPPLRPWPTCQSPRSASQRRDVPCLRTGAAQGKQCLSDEGPHEPADSGGGGFGWGGGRGGGGGGGGGVGGGGGDGGGVSKELLHVRTATLQS